MDIKRVGDHECIHCGACVSVCPTKAISWKGEKLFVRSNDIGAPTTAEDIKPLSSMVKSKEETAPTQTEVCDE
jgi:ferredoxin